MNFLIKKLIKKKLKIALAESCTGGKLASVITSSSGASKVFNLGLVTYSDQAKISVLKINRMLIKKHGAVSPECCKAMVKNLAKISKSHINVSITGVAGPNGGSKSKPVGLVYIGLSKGKKIIISKNFFKSKNRISIQRATVNKALRLVSSII